MSDLTAPHAIISPPGLHHAARPSLRGARWARRLAERVTDVMQTAIQCLSPLFSRQGRVSTELWMKVGLIALMLGCCVAAQASACPDDPGWKTRLLEQLNAMRASGGVCAGGNSFAPASEPLRWNPLLEAAALAQTVWMSERGELLHVGRAGEGLGERARQVDYAYERVGENVAMGYFQMEQVLEAWRASAKHCNNLMDPRFTEVALACVRAANGPWWTITVGRPGSLPSSNTYARARQVSWTPR